MSTWREKANKALTRIGGLLSDPNAIAEVPPKERVKEDVANYVARLWEDGKKFYYEAFENSKPVYMMRRAPEEFIRACSLLENGDVFEALGHRDKEKGELEWIDGEMQDQIRARTAYLNSNWHDVTISPNLKGINDILDSERKDTSWGRNTRSWTRHAQHFGDVWVESYLDKSRNPNGIATEKTLRPLSFFWTPGCQTIDAETGCYYAVHGEQVTGQWVKKNYPDLDLSSASDKDLKTPSLIGKSKGLSTYQATKFYDKFKVYMDDESFVEIPFDPQEFDIRIGALMQNVDAPNSVKVFPSSEDNHPKWIKAYQNWLEEKMSFYQKREDSLTQTDVDDLSKVIDLVDDQIVLHQDEMEQDVPEDQKIPAGKKKAYPFGRRIVVINGVVAEDIPNPYEFEWRRLFRNIANETIPERLDGRGDVEILIPTEYGLSMMLSHQAEDERLNGQKKPYFPMSEKAEVEENWDADPKKPGFFNQSPPVFPDGQGTHQAAELYGIRKQNASRKLGVSSISFGQSPTATASGDMVDSLNQANEPVLTGELNHNMNDAIEDIVETRIMMWKKFYTDKRIYKIDGVLKELVLAEYLTYEEAKDGQGQVASKKIPAIQVTVRPNSNFPMKWENTLSMLLNLMTKVDPATQMPLIPFTMVQDLLAERFPGLSKEGQYRQDSQALAIGKQVMEEQAAAEQQKQAEEQGLLDQAHARAQKDMVNEALPQGA